MNLYINGENYSSETELTIGQLLKRLELHPDRVVIELNQNILNTADHTDTKLHEADKLEIIQFVGGG